eukprot:TRINITY_DN2603_c0_g1_i1.p1 TRINITY_DN2603_c0_g1~~TRINITY_DN2603_c0_g1_i1.p1  ORF type:complete len:635 (+),score=93.32 TRINITY_DN2603_c0_g1_i1:30-1907(+)
MPPTNHLVGPLLSDMYQVTMAYAYWQAGRHLDASVFELFYRTNPFKGQYCVFAGLSEALEFVRAFRFTRAQADYLQRVAMPNADPAFFTWLQSVDSSEVKIYAVQEGTIVFPFEPLIRVEGPLAICQLLETTLLNLVGFSTLICTNARRMVQAGGEDKVFLEFGLRRAQGPDGGLSASRYSYIGGFHGTSNLLAGQLFDIPVKGTHAHAFVTSYTGLDQMKSRSITMPNKAGTCEDFVDRVLVVRREMGWEESNEGELAAFMSYAQAFPETFLALVDTYDTINSGVPNFLAVAVVLKRLGYSPLGVRLDSGDLAVLSREVRQLFVATGEKAGFQDLRDLKIVASNDLHETAILELEEQGHEIDTFGIGTHLVTCKAQPALGCVYKLVEVNHVPRIKVSEDAEKTTIPGRKQIIRLFGEDNHPIGDLLATFEAPVPQAGQSLLVFPRGKPNDPPLTVKAKFAQPILRLFHGKAEPGEVLQTVGKIRDTRDFVHHQVKAFPSTLFLPKDAQPYPVWLSQEVNDTLRRLLHETGADKPKHAEVELAPAPGSRGAKRPKRDEDLRAKFRRCDPQVTGRIRKSDAQSIFISQCHVSAEAFERALSVHQWSELEEIDYQKFEVLLTFLDQV